MGPRELEAPSRLRVFVMQEQIVLDTCRGEVPEDKEGQFETINLTPLQKFDRLNSVLDMGVGALSCGPVSSPLPFLCFSFSISFLEERHCAVEPALYLESEDLGLNICSEKVLLISPIVVSS